MISKYLIGLDLGQQNDYTVLSILQFNYLDTEGRYGLVHLRKYPLRSSYPDIIRQLVSYISKNFTESEYIMVVDYTGVGRPVVDSFREEGLTLIAANITAGATSSWKGTSEVSIPKKEIVSTLQIILQNKKLKIASDLHLINDLKTEFLNFKATISRSGRSSFEAKSGHHDDIVMSIGLATWYGEHCFKRGRKIRIISGN